MRYPLDNMYITSEYGMRRHPVFGYNKMHLGIDLRARKPTKTYSILEGVVKVSKHQVDSKGKSVGLGSYIIIEHELNGIKFCTMVCHLSKRYVKAGQKVKEGMVVGLTGNTGSSSAPHLHFGVHYCPFNQFFTYNYKKSGSHSYREFKHTIDPDKFMEENMKVAKKGENMSERVDIRIKMSGKVIEDCELETVNKLKLELEPYEIVKDEPKDSKFYTTPEHHRGKYYNIPIPQITFKKKLYIKNGRSFKDPMVGYIQRALQMFGLYEGIDDWYGKNTHAGVVELRKRLNLPNGEYLTETDIHKFNRAIIDNIHLWVDTDNDIMLWYSGSNNDYMGVITKLRPQSMDFTIQDKSASSYTNIENAMTSSFQWYESAKRKMHKYGVCRNKDGDNISMYPGQVHGKPCMVVYSKATGGFGIDNNVLRDQDLPKYTGFVENGWEMYPNSNAWKESGFTGTYSDVTRTCERVVYLQLYGELYGGVYSELGKANAYQMGKDMYLGAILSVDGGGSTFLKLTWVRKGNRITKVFYTTSRRLYQMATWK